MRINPGLQVLSIVEGTIQIGTGHRARWITGLDPAEQQFVLSLCGREPAGEPAAAPLLPPERQKALLSVLRPVLIEPAAAAFPSPGPATASASSSSGVSASGAAARAAADAPGSSRLTPDILQWSAAYELDAGPVLRQRANARVAIHHLGRTGQMLAGILAASGIGSLLLCDADRMQPEDLGAATTGINSVGQLRARAASRALAQTYPRLTLAETAQRGPDAAPVDLAVVIAGGLLPDLGLLPQDERLLPILFTDAGVRIGPMVIPGLTMCDACAWEQCDPTLRIVPPGGHLGRQHPVRPEASLAATAAGTAATQILMALDEVNVPAAAEAMILCDLATGATRQVPARQRPGCTCLDGQAA
ncbi:ThiF family adenylyltransferase [Paeniglutamicibacter kerguelensis]|uniref:THIF-type NAD/FAD binding fold domain-containing protein n=1 Tax=Paeniglutamicibacter kerguelensis TaxID=254788 RepID=A0ABS4XE25_9MICC|nr:ThiF family adenylyltransferase [Paeniglutamicibacter kerguelensis]MBP2386714.1 hypothetical protein [Paeniglutamicibacter kerguelensis]